MLKTEIFSELKPWPFSERRSHWPERNYFHSTFFFLFLLYLSGFSCMYHNTLGYDLRDKSDKNLGDSLCSPQYRAVKGEKEGKRERKEAD